MTICMELNFFFSPNCIEFNQITSMMSDPTKAYDIIEDNSL